MSKEFLNIGEIISSEKDFDNLRKAVEEQDIVNKFEEIFPEFRKAVVAIKAEKRILFLRTNNSVWKSELSFRKELLIKKINGFFGKEVIKGIKFI